MNDVGIAFNRKVFWTNLLDCLRQFPAGSIAAIEVCATSHFGGRIFQSIGYLIRIISTQHVKTLMHYQKNDADDALGVCEMALLPGIHIVAVKTIEQQDIKPL